MKSIIIATLLVGGSLMAADSVKANNSGSFSEKGIDGAVLYEKNCAICHGKKAEKSPEAGVPPLASRDATRLALTIRAYRDQDKNIGTYTMHKSSEVMQNQTVKFSDRQIGAIAKYISGLK